MSDNLVAVLMAGGAGTRFWPVSTESKPKQFLSLFGDRSLLQQSLDRLRGLVPPERVLVLTHRDFVPLVREQLPEVPEQQVIGEPMRRDTAAAVALAALLTKRLFGDATMAVLTADHRIEPVTRFQEVLRSAADGAEASRSLYTFGIVPTYAATAYGYLHRGERLGHDDLAAHYRLTGFKEKPDLATARHFLATGEYYWNSGMFVWRTEAILAELERQLPTHLERLAPAVEAFGSEEALRSAFEGLDRISIDFGVMEKAADVRMVEADFEWSDVGGWRALEPFLDEVSMGNRARGRLATLESIHNTVFCEDPSETVALVGVEDLVVIRAGRRTLVASRSHLEDIKKLVEGLDDTVR